jgi:hypothetical protein
MMQNNIRDSVVVITSKANGNDRFGSGFVLRIQDGLTYVVTCAHVVRDVGGPENVLVDHIDATVLVLGEQGDPDLAVLSVRDVSSRPALPLQSAGKTGLPIMTAGFQIHDRQRLIRQLEGALGDQVDLEALRRRRRIQAWDLNLDGDHALKHGFSGSPLVDRASGRVIGVVSHREGEGRRGLAISVCELEQLWDGTPFSLFETGRAPASRPVPGAPLMNFEKELAVFNRIAAGEDARTRALLIRGASGMGKTRLLKEYEQIAADHGIVHFAVPLDQQLTIDQCLSQLVYGLGADGFPRFAELLSRGRPSELTRDREMDWARSLTLQFFGDLRQRPTLSRFLVFFDPYEKADRELKSWLIREFMPALSSVNHLTVIVAGQDEIQLGSHNPAHICFQLTGVSEQCYVQYAAHCRVVLQPDLVHTLHEVLGGRPKDFVDFIQARMVRQ